MKKIRWGIISTGTIAHSFASDCRFVATAELLAVASRTQATADDFAATYSIPRAYGSYAALFNDADIDAVYIATPHTLHYQNTIDALRAGKAVLCEKPLTVTPAECRELMATAADTGSYLMEGMWTYFLPAMQNATLWVSTGRIGAVKHVKADFGYAVPFDPLGRMYNPQLAGGALFDMGVYTLAMAHHFIHEEPRDVRVISRRAVTGVDHDVIMLLEYADAAATLTTSFRSKLHNAAFIIGETGYIMIPDFWRARECFLYQNETCVDHFVDSRESLGFNFEIEAVNNDLLHGRKQSTVMPLAKSLLLQQRMKDVRDRFSPSNTSPIIL